MPDFINFKFIGQGGTRTNQRHPPAQNVPELRKFIKARLPQESAEGSHAGIIRDFVDHGLTRVAVFAIRLAGNKTLDVLLVDARIIVGVHRSELQALKARSKLAKPLLLERSEEHTSELQSRQYLVCRLLLEKKKTHTHYIDN